LKFTLFVEGHTEKRALPSFLKRWLDAKLPAPVGIKIVRFEGWHDYVKEIDKKVHLNLTGKAGPDVIAGIGLIDLYGPTFYPTGVSTAAQRYQWAKNHIEGKVNNARFRQYFAVHETEAWLLADPSILPSQVATALPGGHVNPEGVNFSQPPKKLLEHLYRARLGRGYNQVIDGTNLFLELDPNIVYKKCPYFGQLLDEMLQLAQGARP